MSPWLSVPDAIQVVGQTEPGGWPAVMKRNRELALEARRIVCDALSIDAPSPEEMVGSMFAIPLPDRAEGEDVGDLLSPLNQELLDVGYETLVLFWPRWPKTGHQDLGPSVQRVAEYRLLAETLKQMVG